MKSFDEVVSQLCETYKMRKCSIISNTGNVIKIQSNSTMFYDNLAYFKAVCDCYMATNYGSTAWIIEIDIENYTIELGCNY
jgi:hypothetical protein